MFDQARIMFTPETVDKLLQHSKAAQKAGNLGLAKRIQALLALDNGVPPNQIASVLGCSVQAVYLWIKEFILKGLASLQQRKSPGRPSKLTAKQRKKLGELIDDGPEECGYPGACWRSPMIQDLILREFGKFYSAKYIAELLKNMNFSFQKAKFVSDHLNEKKREQWLNNTWPEILELASKKNALIMFGDEVSFPMWGSLSHTWSRKGHQPTIKTSGRIKGHKIFGLISYADGKFFSSGIAGRFNSESYIEFLNGVINKNDRHIILIQDGARYHTSKQTREFFQAKKERLTVYQLPSYSPDYNPIEKLWKKIKQTHIHLHYFPTFTALKNKVQEALLKYQNLQDEVLALFGFYRKINHIKA